MLLVESHLGCAGYELRRTSLLERHCYVGKLEAVGVSLELCLEIERRL
jgi:hypothetical protein